MGLDRKIFVTTRNMQRLLSLLDSTPASRNAEALENLESELAAAVVVAPDQIPPTVVTMGSTVRFRDEATDQTREVTLVYPQEANAQLGKVSILAPVGAALIGLSVGESIDWPLPGGRRKRFRLEAILYQPESEREAAR